MNNTRLCDIPKLGEWFGDEGSKESDNLISAHINELKDCISELQFMAENFGSDDEERRMLNHSSRQMASVLHDLKSIRSEVRTASLIREFGAKLQKGGE